MRRQLRIELTENPAQDVEAVSYVLNRLVTLREGDTLQGYWKWGEGGAPWRAFTDKWWIIDDPEKVPSRNGI